MRKISKNSCNGYEPSDFLRCLNLLARTGLRQYLDSRERHPILCSDRRLYRCAELKADGLPLWNTKRLVRISFFQEARDPDDFHFVYSRDLDLTRPT